MLLLRQKFNLVSQGQSDLEEVKEEIVGSGGIDRADFFMTD